MIYGVLAVSLLNCARYVFHLSVIRLLSRFFVYLSNILLNEVVIEFSMQYHV